MLETLSMIGNQLHNKKITWGVGGSLLLKFHNLIEHPNDIDILVDETDAAFINKHLSSIGHPKKVNRSHPFRTACFNKYSINNTDIDIMGGFAIQHSEGIYKLSFTDESVTDYQKINGVNIPLCALEDWYVLYWLIPNKHEKATIIENHLKTHGVTHPRLLEEALKQPLPFKVEGRIKTLLG